jgi:hypothetical protein
VGVPLSGSLPPSSRKDRSGCVLAKSYQTSISRREARASCSVTHPSALVSFKDSFAPLEKLPE